MNLLEHYIEEVHDVLIMEKTSTSEKTIVVDMTINCYGCRERINRMFPYEIWVKIKEKGYYFA